MNNIPEFGFIADRVINPDGSVELVRRNYYHGGESMAERLRGDDEKVLNDEQAYAMIVKGLGALKSGATRVDFSVFADPKTRRIVRLVTVKIERSRK